MFLFPRFERFERKETGNHRAHFLPNSGLCPNEPCAAGPKHPFMGAGCKRVASQGGDLRIFHSQAMHAIDDQQHPIVLFADHDSRPQFFLQYVRSEDARRCWSAPMSPPQRAFLVRLPCECVVRFRPAKSSCRNRKAESCARSLRNARWPVEWIRDARSDRA